MLRASTKRRLPLLAVAVLAYVFSSPLSACVICGSEGSCYDQPSTLSGNCECKIVSRNHVLVCRPVGVCDQNDATSCDDGTGHTFPTQLTSGGTEIETRFLSAASAKDPLLGGALWGAMEEEEDAAGRVTRTRLIPGEHKGTLGTRGHGSYTYVVDVRQLAGGVFTLSVRVEEEHTGELKLYDGAIYDGGERGEVARVSNEGHGRPVVVWDLRERARPRQ